MAFLPCLVRPPLSSSLFPYTTLFRSGVISTTSLIDDIIRLIARPAWDRNIKFVLDRKSTRLNSSHVAISYAVFCFKKKNHAQLHAPRPADQSRGHRPRSAA